MSLSPSFVIWDAIFFTLSLILGVVGWLTFHRFLARVLRHVWLSDVVAVWLAYAAAYHLMFFTFGPRGGLLGQVTLNGRVYAQPMVVWGLCVLLGGYAFLRVVPTRMHRPETLFVVIVLVWALVIGSGYRFIDITERDMALLRDHPQAVLYGADPDVTPLRRILALARLDPETRTLTERALSMLAAPHLSDDVAVLTFRIRALPTVLRYYHRSLAKLRTYQIVQIGLLGVVLLLWGFARPPQWETL